MGRLTILLFVFCFSSCLLSTVDGFTHQTFRVPDFQAVSSVNLRTTGKRTEYGEAVHTLELTLPSGKQISIHVKPKEGLQSADCLYGKSVGGKIVEQKPCTKVEAYEGIYWGSKTFLGFLDKERTLMKGLFEHEGETYFIDPTFEHASNLELHNRIHLAKGPMIIYPASQAKNDSNVDPLRAAIDNQVKRSLEQNIGPAKTNVKYPAPRFPSGQCSQSKTVQVRIFLDHSFLNRWKNEKSTFNDPFAPSGGSWTDTTAFFTLYVGAMSKYVYETSVGVNMMFSGLFEHPNPNDTPWNSAGQVVGRRYKCPNDINSILETFTNWCQRSDECLRGNVGTLNHLITDCQRLYPGEGGTVGLAWVGVICSSSNTGTCTYLPGREGYQCSAHEIGHNFGAPHDFRPGNQDIMSYENTKYDGFSDQTYGAVCKHLGNQGYRCLPNPTGGSTVCTPNCNGKTCGNDGCGGLCGTCKTGQSCSGTGTCVSTVPTCVPNCMGSECGSDGCGGQCGNCRAGTTCSPTQRRCVSTSTCTPDCKNKGCGVSDGCEGICGTACDIIRRIQGFICDASTGFQCALPGGNQPTPGPSGCIPKCDGKTCGNDGCGGSCGTCGRGTTCNTQTSQCTCVPQTSCSAQRKTCGTIFDGCSTVTCGPACTTCTPNPNACQGKTCGFVSNGCDVVSCGSCLSTSDAQTCVNNQCVRNDQCGSCANDATCVSGTCVCRPGFIGDGKITCVSVNTPDPTTPGAWVGNLRGWNLSPDGKIWSSVNPSRDPNNPSLIRWTNSRSLLAATEVTVSINVAPRTAQAMGGVAIAVTDDKYIAFVASNNQVLAHSGTTSNSGPWFVLGNYATGAFTPSWVALSFTLTQYDAYSVTLKGTANGQSFLNNCGANCIGINITSYLQLSTPDGGGDLGLFNLVDQSDFNQLKISTKTRTFTTLANCIKDDAELKRQLSNAMDLDENLIQDLNNPCKTKRSTEQTSAVVSFTTVGETPLSASAIGPSVMASQIESGGALASSAASLSITSVAPVPAAVGTGATFATAQAVPESSVVAGLGSGLSSGAIAGIVIAAIVGVAVVGVVAVVAVKSFSGSSEQSDAKLDHVRFSDAASPPPYTPPSNVPKGGKDILIPGPDSHTGHTSITGRAPAIQHTPK